MRVTSLALLASALLVSACSDAGRIGEPVTGRLSWLAYLGGEDIRDSCKPGSPARYRFVYNAVLDVQIRSYDLVRTETGATLQVRVPHPGFALVDVRTASANMFAPVRDARSTLDAASYRAIARQLEDDGFGAPTLTGRNFSSWDYYWIVSACAEGRFHINGWHNGSPGFAALRFPALLYAQDRTEIPVNPVSPNVYADHLTRMRNGAADLNFDVQLAPGGLRHQLRPF
ncbi:MAG: hypothetical protein JNL71_18290 [Rhodospirillales bacterium]|nr:hypothetical protein [Rhodospirillales bacterium]